MPFFKNIGIEQFANLMRRLSQESPANEQLDDELLELSGYNAARARLFPDISKGNINQPITQTKPRSRRDWPEIRFDQQRDLWVCVAHDNPACSECPNALAMLSARNQGRSRQ